MVKVMRTYCELKFQDEELYKNLIEPHTKSKTLKSLVMQLLNAYYYDEATRERVDEWVSQDDTHTNSVSKKASELIKEAQNKLFFIGACVDSANGSLEGGLQLMQENMDKFSSIFGNNQNQDNSQNLNIQNPAPTLTQPSDTSAKTEDIDALKMQINSLQSKIDTLEGNGTAEQLEQKVVQEEVAVTRNTDSYLNVDQSSYVLNNQAQNNASVSDSVVNTEPVLRPDSVKMSPKPVAEPVVETPIKKEPEVVQEPKTQPSVQQQTVLSKPVEEAPITRNSEPNANIVKEDSSETDGQGAINDLLGSLGSNFGF